MLCLTRTVGESIEIPELGIKFVVIEIRGSKIILGLEAPRDVKILRSELIERIQSDAISTR